MDIFPTVATVAAEDPEIAANNAHKTTFKCIKLQGNFSRHNLPCARRFFVLNKIAPIQTNKGKAVNVHDDEVPHIVVAIASPTGLDVNNIIPIAETPIILKATQIPEPKKNSKTLIKKIVKKNLVIFITSNY
mgnify:CR=1 FL=1